MHASMKRSLTILAALAVAAALAGCNTMRGFGEDISALGRSLSSASGAAGGTH